MITSMLAVVLLVCPVKPDSTLKFKNISITQALVAARVAGVKLELPSFGGQKVKIEGRILTLTVEMRGKLVVAKANGFNVPGDIPWIRWLEVHYNRFNGDWYIKGELFGGLIEATGKD